MLKTLLIYLKFRTFKFKKEGLNCKYRHLNSKYSYSENIKLGNNIYIGPGCDIDGAGSVTIGDGVIIAPEVCIYSRTHNFDSENLSALPFDNVMWVKKVIIENYVWIGRRAIILPGIRIGEGAVVGAGAVVSKNVPDYAVVVGNPAKVIRYRNVAQFEDLKRINTPFVYNRHGHAKIFKEKNS